MPIRPQDSQKQAPTSSTSSNTFSSGPIIQLISGESVELSWQERALCAQTDPEAFFPKKADQLVKQSESVFHAMCVHNVWNTHLHMMNVSEFGADFQNANAAV